MPTLPATPHARNAVAPATKPCHGCQAPIPLSERLCHECERSQDRMRAPRGYVPPRGHGSAKGYERYADIG